MKPAPIDAGRVAAAVVELGLDWHYLDETGSTNADALAGFARDGRERVVFAERQSAGRGRRGRSWHSPKAVNLYCTLGLRKRMPLASQGLISLAVGVALVKSLRRFCDADIDLKWPNDLLAGGAKLGGVLIESRGADDGEQFYAIGFGLNLLMSAADLASIEPAATSLQQLTGRELDRSEVLIDTLIAVSAAVRNFEVADVGRLIEDFNRYDRFHGKPVDVLRGAERIHGIHRGISESGELRLETANGLQTFAAAEISMRGSAR